MTDTPLDPTDPAAPQPGPDAGAVPPPQPPPPPPGYSPQPQQGWAPPPPQRRLFRRRDDRVLAGVASGLGSYLSLDPLLVRIGFVALTFLGGVGIALYVAGWLLIPEPDGTAVIDHSSIQRLQQRYPRWGALAAAVLIVIAVAVLVSSLDIGHVGLVWGVLLVGVGVLLLVEEGWQPFGGSPPAAPPAYGGPGAMAPYGAVGAPYGYTPPPAASFAPTSTAPPWSPATTYGGAPAQAAPVWVPRAPRKRSFLGIATVAVALLAVGVAALLDNAGVVSLSLGAALALVLLVIGAGLIVGTWFGRSIGLVVIGVMLIPFAAAAALVHEPLDAGAGNRALAPQTLTAVSGDYRLSAGHLTVDLSHVTFDGQARTVTTELAVGQIDVIVPATVSVDITGHVGAGQMELLGHIESGVDIDSAVSSTGAAGAGSLHLDIQAGFGHVVVVRGAEG
jgi:phage shock protein PspC (stress-responsive transcriptional regulator)